MKNYDTETADIENAAADEISRLRTVLNAWYEVFGTTQLTHARCRLEAAERAANACAREHAAADEISRLRTVHDLIRLLESILRDASQKHRVSPDHVQIRYDGGTFIDVWEVSGPPKNNSFLETTNLVNDQITSETQ